MARNVSRSKNQIITNAVSGVGSTSTKSRTALSIASGKSAGAASTLASLAASAEKLTIDSPEGVDSLLSERALSNLRPELLSLFSFLPLKSETDGSTTEGQLFDLLVTARNLWTEDIQALQTTLSEAGVFDASLKDLQTEYDEAVVDVESQLTFLSKIMLTVNDMKRALDLKDSSDSLQTAVKVLRSSRGVELPPVGQFSTPEGILGCQLGFEKTNVSAFSNTKFVGQILADLEAGRTGIQPMDADEIPDLFPVLKGGWHFPLPFVVLILALFYWNLSPELSALASAFTILITSAIFGYNGQRFTIVRLIQAVHDTGLAVLDIIMIGAAAGIIIGSLNVTGIGFGLSLALVEIGNSNLFTLLLVSAGICILLGMGMPTVAVYMLLATLVAPALVEVGIEPLAAHLFILYFGMMSMITPPVAIAAFTAASLSGADAMRTGFSAMRFGWFAYIVPFLFVFSPPLLMQGKPIEIIWAAVSAAIGVWLVSIATMGFFRRNLNSLNRLLFGLAGTALLIPVTSFSGAYFTDIGGLILGMLLVCREILAERSIKIINA